MRELVECLREWLSKNRSDGSAYSLLTALAAETLKKLASNDPAQREFDAQQLAAAADRAEANDFDASKRWVSAAKLETFVDARRASIEEHFRSSGHMQALRPVRRSPGGKYRTVWYLESYSLPLVTDAPAEGNPPDSPAASSEPLAIRYEFTPPGQVRAAWYAKPLIGAGSFVTRSWRGLLWLAVALIPIGYLLVSALMPVAFMYVRRPVHTADLATLTVVSVMAWVIWRISIRPLIWLLEDRIILATEAWVGWSEGVAQLELALDEHKKRRLRLVRYSAVCPICAGTIELRYSQGQNRRRLVGCCNEAPHEHVFSFDRILRTGRRLSAEVHA